MKKIFILPILIAPIMAHAANPVGPSAVGQGETPVVATVSAPYATAGAETGDTTNVVSASYVKGAYNDAIAAVNKVNADKQGKLKNISNNNEISTKVLSGSGMGGMVYSAINGGDEYTAMREDVELGLDVNLYDTLVSTGTVLDMFNGAGLILSDKQDKLHYTKNNTEHTISDNVIPAEEMNGIVAALPGMSTQDITALVTDTGFDPDREKTANEMLLSAGAVFKLVGNAAVQLKSNTDTIGTQLSAKRISAVTTWGDDTHPTKLQLTTASN